MRNQPDDSSQRSKQKTARFALVLSAINVRRVVPGLQSFVTSGDNFWLVDIYRPFEELKKLLLDWEPDGIITEWIPERSEPILELGFPTVIFTARSYSDSSTSIDVDNHQIGRIAAEHFLGLGLRNFAFYGNNTPYSEQRLEGFKSHLAPLNIHPRTWIEDAGWQRQYIEHWHESDDDLIEWVQNLPKPVAVFAAHDPLGRTLAEACIQKGIQIPDSVAILGVNNDELVCQLINPPLSSINIPWTQMGASTYRLLKDLLAYKTRQGKHEPQKSDFPAPIILPPASIIQRASTNRLAVDDNRFSLALSIIREKACEGLTVKQLVEELRCSRRRLEQQFQTFLNCTPRDEIIRVRIDRAVEILRLSDRTMPDIAEACGFSNAELFTVNFKKILKIGPSAYRKQFRSPR